MSTISHYPIKNKYEIIQFNLFWNIFTDFKTETDSANNLAHLKHLERFSRKKLNYMPIE